MECDRCVNYLKCWFCLNKMTCKKPHTANADCFVCGYSRCPFSANDDGFECSGGSCEIKITDDGKAEVE